MKTRSGLHCLIMLLLLVAALPALEALELIDAAHGQTKEPPLFGQPQKVPPPPPPPQKMIQQPAPVPIVPGPGPGPGQIKQPMPGAMPAPVVTQPQQAVADPPTPIVKLQVRVAATVPTDQEIEYHLRIQNCSSAPAHHVLVRNPLPDNGRFVRAQPEPSEKGPDVVWSFGTLAPGETREIVLVLAATGPGDIKNCARVQFEHGQCVTTHVVGSPPATTDQPKVGGPPYVADPPQPKQPPQVLVPKSAKLDFKVAGPKHQYLNLAASYQITVVNTGDATAQNLLVFAMLPDKCAFVGASDNGRFHLNQVAWLLGDVPAGGARTVEVALKAGTAGDFCVKSGALADVSLRADAETCTRFDGESPLSIETFTAKGAIGPGGQTSYRVVVQNNSKINLSNVQVQILVPRQLMLARATGDSEPPTPDKLPPATTEGQVLNYTVLKELKAGESKTFEVHAQAVEPGTSRWRVSVSADQLGSGPVLEETSVTVTRPGPGTPRDTSK